MTLSNDIVAFAANPDFYVAFQEYYFNTNGAKNAENSQKLNEAFFAEIEAKSGCARNGLSTQVWAANPQVKWSMFAITDAILNAILPTILTDTFGTFVDMRFVELGDAIKFKVMPSQMFTVSRGAHKERVTFRQKDFADDMIISPVEHIITVYTDMYRVLAGKESIADFMVRVVRSVEQSMYADAMAALSAGLKKIPSGAMNVSGAFDMAKLVEMCETVEAMNGGVKPMICGSATALMHVLPDSTLGFRGTYEANNGSIQLFKDVYGYDVLRFNQAIAKNGKLAVPGNEIYVVSPVQDKLIKGVVAEGLSNGNNFYDNADLTENFTMRKDWDFEYLSNAKAGIYTVTE